MLNRDIHASRGLCELKLMMSRRLCVFLSLSDGVTMMARVGWLIGGGGGLFATAAELRDGAPFQRS